MADEVLENIVTELINRGTFGRFSEEKMQSVLEGMWNKVEYYLKDSRKLAGQLEECFDSKGVQSGLNGRTLNIIKVNVGCICFLSTMNFLTSFV